MPVSKVDNLDLCELWMDIIQPFSDIEYQKKVWFMFEGGEVSTYEDSIDEILNISELRPVSKYQDYLNSECHALIQELVAKVDHYRYSPSYINGESEEKLFADPDWKTIVKLAQRAYHTLESFKKEIEHV